MKKYFTIQTLQDGETPMDPITILTAGASFLSSIFPGLFESRTKLTREMVDRIIPGAGYWTVKLKGYLLGLTQWTVDMKYWYPFVDPNGVQQSGYIKEFVDINRHEICPTCSTYTEVWNKFQNILTQEKSVLGTPSGNFPGYNSTPITTYLILGGATLALLLLSNKKSKRKKS